MNKPELWDSTSRFRFIESCLGLIGCLSISFAVWTTDWIDGRGLWVSGNDSEPDNGWTAGHSVQGKI